MPSNPSHFDLYRRAQPTGCYPKQRIKRIHSDRGTEYQGEFLSELCEERAILHTRTLVLILKLTGSPKDTSDQLKKAFVGYATMLSWILTNIGPLLRIILPKLSELAYWVLRPGVWFPLVQEWRSDYRPLENTERVLFLEHR